MSMQFIDRRPFKERSTGALVRIAVESYASRRAWNAIHVLHFRGTRDVLEAGKRLCRSPKSIEREIGAHILAQLGVAKKTFLPETVKVLIRLLSDKVDDVVVSAGIALGHRGSPKAVPHLVRLKRHKNHMVR
jgi:HEAT repeat protein